MHEILGLPQLLSYENNTDPDGICRAASAVQRTSLQRFLFLMHHVINLTERKKILKTEIEIKKIYHYLVKNVPKYINVRNLL